MDDDRFKALVARLERESAVAPGRYRARVAALTLLGFGILALLFGAVGAGLLHGSVARTTLSDQARQ